MEKCNIKKSCDSCPGTEECVKFDESVLVELDRSYTKDNFMTSFLAEMRRCADSN